MYWSAEGLVCFEFRSGRRRAMVPEILEVLSLLGEWTSVRHFAARHPAFGGEREIRRLFDALVDAGLLECETGHTAWEWSDWSPEAAFFHFGTRGGRYVEDLQQHDRELRAKAVTQPPPPPTKAMAGPSIPLPRGQAPGVLPRVLRERRTWRNFSARPVALAALAHLLQLTWGVQKWGEVEGQGRVAMKTSPSGGARHPIEAYVVALNVAGLRPGVFHYDAAAHHLTDLQTPVQRTAMLRVLAGQDYFAGAAAFVVMSAVFARSMWRYSSSRAYRVLLADAGHLAQTFCLAATAMQLAPFCTMAFDDDALDALLGLETITESSMYVVGVGTRPAGEARRPGRMRKDVR